MNVYAKRAGQLLAAYVHVNCATTSLLRNQTRALNDRLSVNSCLALLLVAVVRAVWTAIKRFVDCARLYINSLFAEGHIQLIATWQVTARLIKHRVVLLTMASEMAALAQRFDGSFTTQLAVVVVCQSDSYWRLAAGCSQWDTATELTAEFTNSAKHASMTRPNSLAAVKSFADI